MEEYKNLSLDIGEAIFDNLLNEGLIKEIPVLRSVVAIARISQNIRDRIFIKKLMTFLHELNQVKKEEFDKFIGQLKDDNEVFNKTGYYLVEIIDKSDETKKVEYIAKLFVGYLYGDIDYSMFRRLCNGVNKAFIDDLITFIKQPSLEETINNYGHKYNYREGLLNSGFTKIPTEDAGITFMAPSVNYQPYEITDLGTLFIQIIKNFDTRFSTKKA